MLPNIDMFKKKAQSSSVDTSQLPLTSASSTSLHFRLGFLPQTPLGAYDAPSDPPVGWGGENPLPILHPHDALSILLSMPSVSRLGAFCSSPQRMVAIDTIACDH